MERWEGRVALVTGASQGIGEDIAATLVKHGLKVVGCARQVELIENNAKSLEGEKGKLYPIKCDLRNEDDILAMFSWIKTELGGVDILVNNAGCSYGQPLLTGNADMWKMELEVNLLAVCICTREAIKSMRERNVNDGQVIHMNSMAGHTNPKNSRGNMYIAVKHAVRSLLEGLRNELIEIKSHIRVAEISPGRVETSIRAKAFGEEKAKQMHSMFKGLDTADVSRSVIFIMSQPPNVQVHDVLVWPIDQPTP